MVKFTKKRVMRRNDFIADDMDWIPVEIDNEENLTLIGAVCQVVDVVRDSHFNSRIFEVAARPILYITNMLNLTEQQAVVYAIVMDLYYDSQISTKDIARFLEISPLRAMAFIDDLSELCRKGYLAYNFDVDSTEKSYCVTKEAITSLQQNCVITPKCSKVDCIDDWFNELNTIVMDRCDRHIDYGTLCMRIDELIEQNRHLQVVKRFQSKEKMLSCEEKMLFLWICNMVVSAGYQTVEADGFRKLYADVGTFRKQRKSLTLGSSNLIKSDLLRIARTTEQRSVDSYELTPWVVNDMLSELEMGLDRATCTKDIIDHMTIVPKQLFYNAKEQKSIEQLSTLLQPTRFAEVRNELKKSGLRSGFACLFHGAPGTGKTETVLQIARATGRNLMQVNISDIKSMWVGESEKNIKAIFTRYRRLVEESEIAPILLFNEADAIIGKRLENVQRSVDKMENSMQNIILEEIEKLDGILIATTNLTCNMDTAFERRFLYKIEFEKPSLEAKCSIWQSMIAGLSVDDALTLASKYDFSGGQIENIARKSVVDRILTGEQLSLETLISHCDSEQLGGNNRRRIGF